MLQDALPLRGIEPPLFARTPGLNPGADHLLVKVDVLLKARLVVWVFRGVALERQKPYSHTSLIGLTQECLSTPWK